MDSKKTIFKNSSSIFVSGDMKKSESELALEELFASDEDDKKNDQKPDIFGGSDQHGFFPMDNAHHLHFPLKNSVALEFEEIPKQFSSITLTDKPFCTTIDSPSSICVDSPQSREQSDEEEDYMEMETNNIGIYPLDDIKRIKRMVSNRESARRSRRRKQAHLSDLEKQVELLRGENASLFKQLAHASHQFKDAATDNRVLKSDVGALRAKVKLAEDLVARGSMTSSLSHLLQNYLNTPDQDYMNTTTMDSSVSPLISAGGDDNSPDSSIAPEYNAEADTFNSNVWTDWESHVAPLSK